jgi:alpha-mannosidase
VNILGSAVNGNHTGQTFVVTYTDGSTSTYQQSLSDWHSPQGYSGESTVTSMAYKLTVTGATHAGPYYFYGYTFVLNTAKIIKSIALPNNRDVVVLGITLVPAH